MKVRENVILKLKKFIDSDAKEFEPFTPEENREVARMIALNFLNDDAFIAISAFRSTRAYQPKRGPYPFTERFEQESSRGWYMKFRQGAGVVVVRDLLGALAFIISLVLALKQLFRW